MTQLQGWLTIASLVIGFISVVFAIGVGWGWVRGELHRICERVIRGFADNDKMHEQIRGDLNLRSQTAAESRNKLYGKVDELSTRIGHLEGRHK